MLVRILLKLRLSSEAFWLKLSDQTLLFELIAGQFARLVLKRSQDRKGLSSDGNYRLLTDAESVCFSMVG
jgi:hypothetical protein